MNVVRYLPVLGCLLVAPSASAITIDYDLVSLGDASYRYNYTVTNDGSLGAGVSIELFDIFFDTSLYLESSLAIVSANPPASDWDEQILGAGFLIEPAYDAFALAGGIADGTSVAGFAVQFEWLGADLPSAQDFEIYSSDTFELLEVGTTRLAEAPVPEPSTLTMLLLAPLLLAGQRRQQVMVPAGVPNTCF